MVSVRDKLANKQTKLASTHERMVGHPAAPVNHGEGEFVNADIALIKPNPHQPRRYFDVEALSDLTESIKQKGVIQPIVIRKDEEGNFCLVAGERRLRAAREARLDKIPAILTKGNPIEISLIENLQREDLYPIEEAEAIARMIDEYNYTQAELAFVIGKARTTVSEAVSLNRLPEEIKEECRRADIYPRRLLVEIAKQKQEEDMKALFKKSKEGNLKSDQVRKITRKKRINRSPDSRATRAIGQSASMYKILDQLDFGTLKNKEREILIAELKKLKDLIEKLI
ncbi:MAG: ParB/RepB/Spo0J family partition protein [Deltaproteobacteria bacterium]|nr:ParB/RepB/Spo0J family partition protein [Deltaproteobacteria bacterium]